MPDRAVNQAETRPALRSAIVNMGLFGGCWAIYLAIGKKLPRGYSTFEVLWWRYALHVLLTLLVIGPVQRSALIKTRHLRLQLLRGLFMVITSISAVLAVHAMSLDEVRLILWLAPLAVIALHRLVRGCPAPRFMWVACIVCWVGTFLILRPSLSNNLHSIFWALVTAVALGGYQLLTASLRSDPATTSVFYSGLVTLVAMSALMPWVWKPVSGHTILICLAMGIAGWMSLLFLDKGLHTLEPGQVVVFGYSHLIAGVVIGSAVSGHWPGKGGLAGTALILAAAVFTAVRPLPRRQAVAG